MRKRRQENLERWTNKQKKKPFKYLEQEPTVGYYGIDTFYNVKIGIIL